MEYRITMKSSIVRVGKNNHKNLKTGRRQVKVRRRWALNSRSLRLAKISMRSRRAVRQSNLRSISMSVIASKKSSPMFQTGYL